MSPCAPCIHFKECFERRGHCREYKTLEDIRAEVEIINENQKKLAERTETNKAGLCADTQRSDRHGEDDKDSDASGSNGTSD